MDKHDCHFYGFPVTKSEIQLMSYVADDGYHFSRQDIKELIQSMRHPSKELQEDTKQFDKEMKASYRKHEQIYGD